MKNTKKGFTLIELLIVITIIGILAAALLPNILGAPARARDAARQADMNNIIAALEAYNLDQGEYPDNSTAAGECISDIPDAGTFGAYFPGGLPEDPGSSGVGDCSAGYLYCKLDGSPSNYIIASYGETDSAVNADQAALSSMTACNGTSTTPGALFTAPDAAIAIVK